jgi:very-short-patch-repair endonuclease
VDVSVPGCRGAGRPGIALHRVRTLDPPDRTVHDGIPVTSVARTLLDLAGVVPYRRLKYAYEQAERLAILDLLALRAVCDCSRRRRGLKALTTLIADPEEPPDVRSQLERLFDEFCRKYAFPRPVFNVHVAGATVDALWPQQRVIVEADSWTFHRSRSAFENDRKRDAELQLAGYRVLRVTWRQLQDSATVARTLQALLAA